jgi:hypothetical protein
VTERPPHRPIWSASVPCAGSRSSVPCDGSRLNPPTLASCSRVNASSRRRSASLYLLSSVLKSARRLARSTTSAVCRSRRKTFGAAQHINANDKLSSHLHVMKTKRSNLICVEDVPQVFTDERIADLARKARLPANANLVQFGGSVREAARAYLLEAHAAPHLVRRELVALYRASERAIKKGDSCHLEALHQLSQAARDWLLDRLARQYSGRTTVNRPLSYIIEFSSCPVRLRSLLIQGGRMKPGRRRSNGHNSRPTFEPLLWAPTVGRGQPRNSAARTLVMLLRIGYLEAVGKPPARTAHHDNPGPFARLVRGCLRLLGAKDVDAVQAINAWEKIRRKSEKAAGH